MRSSASTSIADKVADVAAGRPPIVEPGLEELLGEGVADGRITATTDAREAVLASDLTMITVGTPSRAERRAEPRLPLPRVRRDRRRARVRAEGPRRRRAQHGPAGDTRALPRAVRRARATTAHLAFNPEFLREGSAIADFDGPPYTVIGTEDPVAEQRAAASCTRACPAPLFVVRPEVAEMVKYVANAWHAAKIVFANEVGRLAEVSASTGARSWASSSRTRS